MSQYASAGVPAPVTPRPVTYTRVASTTTSPRVGTLGRGHQPATRAGRRVVGRRDPGRAADDVPGHHHVRLVRASASDVAKPVDTTLDHSRAPAGLYFRSSMVLAVAAALKTR